MSVGHSSSEQGESGFLDEADLAFFHVSVAKPAHAAEQVAESDQSDEVAMCRRAGEDHGAG